MRIKIISDSASDVFQMEGIDFQSVPLKIMAGDKEYVDNESLDVEGMVDDLRAFKGKSSTACPGVGEYLAAFEDYDVVYVTTIISTLSGSYNAAMQAKARYEEENPGKKVFVVDSYSTGGEELLHLEKLVELAKEGKDFDTVCEEITDYKTQHTGIVFSLESMFNLANNGRVPMVVAKALNFVGMRVIGIEKDGRITPVGKARGEKKAIEAAWDKVKEEGYKGGKVRINHCFNRPAAEILRDKILAEYPDADIKLTQTGALCSFYAEKGGLIIGFER